MWLNEDFFSYRKSDWRSRGNSLQWAISLLHFQIDARGDVARFGLAVYPPMAFGISIIAFTLQLVREKDRPDLQLSAAWLKAGELRRSGTGPCQQCHNMRPDMCIKWHTRWVRVRISRMEHWCYSNIATKSWEDELEDHHHRPGSEDEAYCFGPGEGRHCPSWFRVLNC